MYSPETDGDNQIVGIAITHTDSMHDRSINNSEEVIYFSGALIDQTTDVSSDRTSQSHIQSVDVNMNQDSNNPSSSHNEVAIVDPVTRLGMQAVDDTAYSNSSKNGYCIRWSRIEKRVQISGKAGQGNAGSMRGSVMSHRSSVFVRHNKDSKVETSGVGTNGTSKEILKGVSGYALPGEILAVMGPSGSGKTSLLNVLSGRSSYQNGIISINGDAITSGSSKIMKRLKSQIAYVKQADIFFEHLTVRDQFTYTARLRLSGRSTKSNNNDASTAMSINDYINQKVDDVIHQLRLGKVANNAIQLCSGGEKKRINIGSEILTDPAVIMLDEPTSGLDSSSAVSLIRLLSTFAKGHGKTVITSIHQPSSAVFRSFDRLIMLSDGYVVYFGTPVDSITYLRTRNLACPDGYNAADHWMDMLVHESSADYQSVKENGQNYLNNISNGLQPVGPQNDENSSHLLLSPRLQLEQAWDDVAIADVNELSMNMNSTNHSNNSKGGNGTTVDSGAAVNLVSKYNTSWLTQYTILTSRAFKHSHSSIFTPINLTKSVAMGLVSGLLWFKREYTERDARDIESYVFFTMTFWTFDSMFNALTTFPSERSVILKERSSASYHLSAYFMAKTTADAPVRWMLPTIYMIVSYWMAGFSYTVTTFITTTMCTLLSVLAGEAIGLLVGAAVYDLQKAITIMTVFTLFLMLIGGFWIDTVPSFLKWGKYVSPFKYAFDGSIQLIFTKPVPCDGSGSLGLLCQTGVSSVSVKDMLKLFGVTGTIGFNIGILIFLCFIPRYAAYWALRRKKEGER